MASSVAPDEAPAPEAPGAPEPAGPTPPRNFVVPSSLREGRLPGTDKFSVVALGGSAGALEAFEKFFAQVHAGGRPPHAHRLFLQALANDVGARSVHHLLGAGLGWHGGAQAHHGKTLGW